MCLKILLITLENQYIVNGVEFNKLVRPFIFTLLSNIYY